MADRQTALAVIDKLKESGISDEQIRERLSPLNEDQRNQEYDKLALKFGIVQESFKPEITDLDTGRELVKKKNIGSIGAFARGFTDEATLGQGAEIVGAVRGGINALKTGESLEVPKAIKQEEQIQSALEEDRPISSFLGKATGFAAGIGGQAVKQASNFALKVIPKITGEGAKRLYSRLAIEGAAAIGSVGGAKELLETGDIKKTGKAAIENAVAGAVGNVAAPLAIKGATKVVHSVIPDDIVFQLKNAPLVSKLKGKTQEVYSAAEKKIAPAVNSAIDKYNLTIKETSKKLLNNLKLLSSDNQNLKLSAAKNISEGLEKAGDDLTKTFNDSIKVVLDDAKANNVVVNLTDTRNKVVRFLLDNGGLDRKGQKLTGSLFVQEKPRLAATLYDLYDRLGGGLVFKRGEDFNVNLNLRDALFLKRDLGRRANFSRNVTAENAYLRELYTPVRQALENADERLIPINQSFVSAKTNIDNFKSLVGRNDLKFESIINSFAGENKQKALETFRAFKGQLNESVDSAINQTESFIKQKAKIKDIGKFINKPKFDDVDYVSKMIEFAPELIEDIQSAKTAVEMTKKTKQVFGNTVKPSTVERLFRSLDQKKASGQLNLSTAFESLVSEMPGGQEALALSNAARTVDRIFLSSERAINRYLQVVKTESLGQLIGTGYKTLLGDLIDGGYRAISVPGGLIDSVIQAAPNSIKSFAEKNGSKKAFDVFIKTALGKKIVKKVAEDRELEKLFNDEKDLEKTGAINIQVNDLVDNSIAQSIR